MSTNFKVQGMAAGTAPIHELFLNGFHLALSTQDYILDAGTAFGL
jgi:hypothetical protein